MAGSITGGAPQIRSIELADTVVAEPGPGTDRLRARLVCQETKRQIQPLPVAVVAVFRDAHGRFPLPSMSCRGEIPDPLLLGNISQNTTGPFWAKKPNSPVAFAGPARTMREEPWEGVVVMLRNEAIVALEPRAPGRACWLRRDMLESLAEVNHTCLGLFAEQALAQGPQAQPLLRQVGELWRALDERSRWQAAACPYLLVDAAFGEPQRWHWLAGSQVEDGAHAPGASFFTVPQTPAVAR